MRTTMLRMATKLDEAGQHDLADAMERLASKLPFHLDTNVLHEIRRLIPDALDDWIKGLGEAAFDVTKIKPSVHPTVQMPGNFYSWSMRNLHPDNIRDEVARSRSENLLKEINSWYSAAKEESLGKKPNRPMGFDPSRSFIPGETRIPPDAASGIPGGAPSTAGPPPRRTTPRPTPGPPPPGTRTEPPPPEPTPGPRSRGESGSTPPPERPGREQEPPPPRPTPGVAPQAGPPPEPSRTTWQKIPWWAKWGPVGYMGYRVLRPKDERRSTNVTPPQPVLHDPRQDYRDVPYNPYYGR